MESGAGTPDASDIAGSPGVPDIAGAAHVPNTAAATDAAAMLATWREQGADRLDPVRFHFMDALARRTAVQDGHARQVLDEKLAGLLDTYGRDLAAVSNGGAAPPEAVSMDIDAAGTNAAAPADAPGTLADLLGTLAARTSTAGEQPVYPDLASLDYFRDVWSRYSTKRQLKQSQERVPENAGPLNSSLLVHRMLSLMGEVSPEYLRQFLSYVDALSWMEQATRIDMLPDKDGARPGAARKSARGGNAR